MYYYYYYYYYDSQYYCCNESPQMHRHRRTHLQEKHIVTFQGESHGFNLVNIQAANTMSFSLKIKKCKIYTCGKLTLVRQVHFRVTKHLAKAVF